MASHGHSRCTQRSEPSSNSSRSVAGPRSRGGSWPGSWVTSGDPSQRAAWSTGRRRKSASTTVTRPAAYAVATLSLVGQAEPMAQHPRLPAGARARARVAGAAADVGERRQHLFYMAAAELLGQAVALRQLGHGPVDAVIAGPARRSRWRSGPSRGNALSQARATLPPGRGAIRTSASGPLSAGDGLGQRWPNCGAPRTHRWYGKRGPTPRGVAPLGWAGLALRLLSSTERRHYD